MIDLTQIQNELAAREERLSSSEESNRKARAALENDKRAFERVAEVAKQLTDPNHHEAAQPDQMRDMTVRQAVHWAVKTFADDGRKDFGTNAVIFAIRDLPPEKKPFFDLLKNQANISRYLSELAEAGFLEITRGAAGSRGASYRVKNPAQPIPAMPTPADRA